MFRGVQHVSMDAKGRMAMPARHREPLMEQCDGHIVATIVTQAPCLVRGEVPRVFQPYEPGFVQQHLVGRALFADLIAADL